MCPCQPDSNAEIACIRIAQPVADSASAVDANLQDLVIASFVPCDDQGDTGGNETNANSVDNGVVGRSAGRECGDTILHIASKVSEEITGLGHDGVLNGVHATCGNGENECSCLQGVFVGCVECAHGKQEEEGRSVPCQEFKLALGKTARDKLEDGTDACHRVQQFVITSHLTDCK